jgi:hypothetical protein
MQAGNNKCDIPPTAPKKIEDVINQCQDEIKLAILSGEKFTFIIFRRMICTRNTYLEIIFIPN